MKTIGVDENLGNVADYLREKGLSVAPVDPVTISGAPDKYDALVLSGAQMNTFGMNDIRTESPIIDASGLTPEEVYERVQRIPR